MTANDFLDEATSQADRLADGNSPEEIIQYAVSTLDSVIEFEVCEILLSKGESPAVSVRLGSTPFEDSDESVISQSVAKRALHGRPLLVTDSSLSDEVDSAYSSILGVPLGEHGALLIGDSEPGAFDEEVLAMAFTISSKLVERLEELTGTAPESTKGTETATERSTIAKEHEWQYETLVEQFPNGIVTLFDEEFRYRLAGGQGLEAIGLSPDDLRGKRLRDIFPAENVKQVEPLYERALEGKPGDTEVTLDGRVFAIQVMPVRDEASDVVGGVTVSQDITGLKENQKELEAARIRYQTLLHAAPDPIFVADADTGVLIEANKAAEELRGQSVEEIVGLHQTELHPSSKATAYRELFEEHTHDNGTVRWLPDGTQIHAVRATGEKVPVEISTSSIELEGRTVIYGIFRNIRDQVEYERALTGLNEASQDLFAADSLSSIGRHVVGTVTEVIEDGAAAFFQFDASKGVLSPLAYAPPKDGEDPIDELPEFGPDEAIAWSVFAESEAAIYDDVRSADDVYNPGTAIRSEILVPLDDWGVLIVGSTQAGAFGDRTMELVEVVAGTAVSALDRYERERNLKAREHQLEQRTKQLERVEAINGQIRDVAQAIVHSETRVEVEQAVCEELVKADPFEFVWIGAPDPVDERLVPNAQAGDHRGYLEGRSLILDPEATGDEPSVLAAQTREKVVISNTAVEMTREEWRRAAVNREFRSVMNIPLIYHETLYGVLSIYASVQAAFDGVVQSVMVELGDLIAHTLAGLNRKQALLSNQVTELDFDIRDAACFFVRFSKSTGCTLELEAVIPQSDHTSLVFVRVQDGSLEQLLKRAESANEITSTQVLESQDETLVQFRFVEPFIASILADQGIVVRSISSDTERCRVTVAVPPTFELRRVVDIVKRTYPESDLLAKREQSQSLELDGGITDLVLDSLTDRQREVVETAYSHGYFDSPRETSSEELAEELGFSTSAFHHHIRAAERTMFDSILGDNASNRSLSD